MALATRSVGMRVIVFGAMLAIAIPPASAAGGTLGSAPANPSSDLRIEREPIVVAASAGCIESAYIEGGEAGCVLSVVVRETQHLFSGELDQSFVVAVRPGRRVYLGCSWARGAMRKADFEVLGVVGRRCRTRPIAETAGNESLGTVGNAAPKP